MNVFDGFDNALGKLGTMWGVPTANAAPPPEQPAPEPELVAVPPATAVPGTQPVDEAKIQAAVDAVMAQSAAQPVAAAPSPAPAPAVATATRTTHEAGKVVPKEIVNAQAEAAEAEKRAIAAKARVESAQDENAARILEAQNNRLHDQQKLHEYDEREAAKRTEDRIREWEGAVADYKRNGAVDPQRYQKKIGWGGRIANAIFIGIGALGAGLTKGPNYALQIVDEEVERDIRAQEHDLNRKKGAVDMAQNGVAFFRQRGLDLHQSHLAARSALYDRVRAELEANAAKFKGGATKAHYDAMLAGLDQRQQAVRANLALDAQGKTVTERTSQPVGPVSLNDQLKTRELEVDVPQEDGSVKTYYAKRKEDAVKIGDAIVAAKGIKQTLNEIETIVMKSRQSISPAARTEVKKLTDHLRTQYGVLQGLGALSDKDYEIAGIVGNPESFFQRDGTTEKLIKQARKIATTGYLTQLEGRGVLRTNLVGR